MHLIRRFLGFILAKPLTPSEQQQVRNLLDPPLARAFFAQRPEDQRHGFQVQQRIGAAGEVGEAALLHDVGKTQSNLGAVSRSLATIGSALGLSVSGSWNEYLDHGPIGAEMLAELNASNLSVGFAQSHPGEAPPDVDPEQWRLLEEADNS